MQPLLWSHLVSLLRIHCLLMRNADLHSSFSHYDTAWAGKAGDSRVALWAPLLTAALMTLGQYYSSPYPVLTKTTRPATNGVNINLQ